MDCSQIFAKALPMPCVIGALKRLEILRSQPELKDKLWKIVNALQTGLKQALKGELPEVEYATRFNGNTAIFRSGEKIFTARKIVTFVFEST